MHIFGEAPAGERRADFISSVVRFDSSPSSPRRLVAGILGFGLSYLLENQQKYSEKVGMSNGAILEKIDSELNRFIREVLGGSQSPVALILGKRVSAEQVQELNGLRERILDINRRIDESDETGALLHGMDGRYIPAGPSGQITRGHDEVLPTGRNFYSLDPYRVPTRSAWRVGQRLADA